MPEGTAHFIRIKKMPPPQKSDALGNCLLCLLVNPALALAQTS